MGHVLDYESPKELVSETNYKEKIRLRWRHQGEGYSLSLDSPFDSKLVTQYCKMYFLTPFTRLINKRE